MLIGSAKHCVWLLLLCSDDPVGVGFGHVGTKDPGYAKIRDLGVQFFVEQNIAGLQISMDDAHPGVLVQVQEALGDALNYTQPLLPV